MTAVHSPPDWLRWVREMQAIAQNGLTFARDPFDVQRYEALRALSSEILTTLSASLRPGLPEQIGAELGVCFTRGVGYATPKLDVRAAVFDRQGHPPHPEHVWKVFVRCELVSGEAGGDGLETDAVGFYGEAELPPLSLTRVLPAQIARLFEHHRNPQLPADFD
jgi:hypothetical protein